MARMSAIDEGGGRNLVLRLVGEGKSHSFIRNKLAEDGVCDLTTQAITHYIENLEADPQMRDAMKVAAKRYREEAADLIAGTSYGQLKAFKELVATVLKKLEPILEEFGGNLAEAMPLRDDESEGQYKARLYAVKSLVDNLPKLDARLEAWVKVMGSLQGTGVFDRGLLVGDASPSNITVNVVNITNQYQRLFIDFIGVIPPEKREAFMERIKAIKELEATP